MDESPLKRDQTPVHRKFILTGPGGYSEIFAEPQARPFSRLEDDAFLDTADLCRIFQVTQRTIYRWIAERDLQWDTRVGREYLFTKGDILDWYEDNRPVTGRPSRRSR
jgi:excisionase family DNA binding protein